MGSDDLFRKRRAKDKKALARKNAKRSSYNKILIVCEGEKTEPNYFNEIKDYYELNTANVVVDGSCGSDPWSVFQYAKKCVLQAKKDHDPYDKIYCVFDKDRHSTFQQTLDAIKSLKAKQHLTAITSVPCFEYWLLLHFTYSTRPFAGNEQKSAGDSVLDELLSYIPDYQKAARGLFIRTQPSLDFAKANALKALQEAINNQTDNPSTHIHELVDDLQNLKNQK